MDLVTLVGALGKGTKVVHGGTSDKCPIGPHGGKFTISLGQWGDEFREVTEK